MDYKVDVAWIPEWVGTEQTRPLTVDGDRLQVLSPWRVNPNWPDVGSQSSDTIKMSFRSQAPQKRFAMQRMLSALVRLTT